MSHLQSASCSRVRAIGLSCYHACARAIVRACFHACVFLLVLACQATHGPHAARAYSSRKRKATTCGEARGVAFFVWAVPSLGMTWDAERGARAGRDGWIEVEPSVGSRVVAFKVSQCEFTVPRQNVTHSLLFAASHWPSRVKCTF